jgi:RimJ/RimL family protein N-acetyltransferase
MTMPFTPEHPPEGYPVDLERSVLLRDGKVAYVRPLVPDDAPTLAHEIATADTETIYLRFFTPVVRIDEARLRHMTELDYHYRLALAAFSEWGDAIGVIRYEGAPGSTEAEVAVTTKQGWRRTGIATALLAMLEEAASQRGIETMVALYLAQNYPARDLFARFGYGSDDVEAGIVRVEKALPPAAGRASA